MLARLWMGCALGLIVALGCSNSDPVVVATAPVSETPALETPPPEATNEVADANPAGEVQPIDVDFEADESLQLAQATPTQVEKPVSKQPADAGDDSDDIDDELSPAAEAKLLAILAKQPNDADLLLKLASFKQAQADMTDSGELDYGKLKESADYVRRALKADPAIADKDEVKSFLGAVFFNEACALSREKKDPAAFKSLRTAIDYGFNDLTEIQNALDLARLKTNPEFDKIVKFARDKRKKDLQATISALFIGKPDYKFNFTLEDTAGKPLVKRDFTGKLLIVNIWGTWCSPCRRELPDLIAAYKKYRSQGVEMIGLNTEAENGITAVNTIRESQKTFGINYRCALGNEELFQQIPDFSAVPMTLFFNRQGELQAQWIGQADEIILEMIIERLLEESPADTKK